MDRNEAVLRLSAVGHISKAYAEDLYYSLFDKPVVPQYVADWYEGNKRNLDLNLSGLVFDLATNSPIYYQEEFKAWVEDNKETFITTLINMHQFGYEVEKEKRYSVKIKGIQEDESFLTYDKVSNDWFFGDDSEVIVRIRVLHTRKELEEANFGWVFDCQGMEVEEVE
nr:MAG TPA: Protein of unknown function (DUF1642) [Caudoviricetes sp.]